MGGSTGLPDCQALMKQRYRTLLHPAELSGWLDRVNVRYYHI